MSPSLSEPGKPHIFLLDDSQQEKNHVYNYTKSPEAVAEFADIVDVMFEIVEKKLLSESGINLLVERLNSRFKVVYEEAGRRLVQLSHYFEDAGKKLVQLMSHRKASIRLRVVQSLWTDTPPREITDSIIRCGLMDKSISVRQFAADRIGQFQLNYFVPQLRELLKNEQNKKVITAAQYTLRRLEKATP